MFASIVSKFALSTLFLCSDIWFCGQSSYLLVQEVMGLKRDTGFSLRAPVAISLAILSAGLGGLVEHLDTIFMSFKM